MPDDALSFAERRAQAVGAAAERELADLREQLVRAETLLAEVPDLREAALEGERQRERAETLRAELHATADELKLARDELDALRRSIHGIETSASWRLTAPLRAAKGRIRGTQG